MRASPVLHVGFLQCPNADNGSVKWRKNSQNDNPIDEIVLCIETSEVSVSFIIPTHHIAPTRSWIDIHLLTLVDQGDCLTVFYTTLSIQDGWGPTVKEG